MLTIESLENEGGRFLTPLLMRDLSTTRVSKNAVPREVPLYGEGEILSAGAITSQIKKHNQVVRKKQKELWVLPVVFKVGSIK